MHRIYFHEVGIRDARPGTGGDPEFTLEVLLQGGTTRMSVITGTFEGKHFTIGAQGEELTVRDSIAIAGMPLHNLPGNIELEYSAEPPDQRAGWTGGVVRPPIVLVLRPGRCQRQSALVPLA